MDEIEYLMSQGEPVRTVDNKGKQRLLESPDVFFDLPKELQAKMLSNYGMNPMDIERICETALTSRGTKELKFVSNICDNYEFWRNKYFKDFASSFSDTNLTNESTSVKYWKEVYESAFFYAQKNLYLILEKVMKTGDILTDEGMKKLHQLISSGITLEGRNPSNNMTVLMLAAKYGYLEAVIALLRAGADVDARDNNEATALMLASFHGHRDVVIQLLHAGANKDARDNKGFTALMIASQYEQLEIVKVLVNAGASLDAQNNKEATALMIASYLGHLDVVKFLIDRGAYVNAEDNNKITALMLASESGQPEIVKALVNARANLNAQGGRNKATALMLASFYEHLDVVRELLYAGANKDAVDKYGYTALMLASETGRLSIVKLLLHASADVKITDNNGLTALDLARRAPESPDKVAIIAELQKYTARGDRFTLTSGIAIQGKQGYAQPRSIKSMELETLKGWLV